MTLNSTRAALGYGGRFVWARAADDRTLVPLLEDALKHLGDEASPLRARLMARLAGALRDELDGGRRATLSAKAVAMARQPDDHATLAYARRSVFGDLGTGLDRRTARHR